MARKPMPEMVDMVLGYGCRIDGKEMRPGDVVRLTRLDAEDMRRLGLARQMLPGEDLRQGGYITKAD